MPPSTFIAPAYVTGMICIGVLGLVGSRIVQDLLIEYRDSTIEPRPQTQKITQITEDTLSPSTLGKLVNSTTYSIREIASRIVCDRALHDEETIESLLWYITRPDHRKREKGLRALFMLCTKSSMAQLNTPRVYSAIVKSLDYCVTDVEHDPYDREFDTWDFRDVNERLCLMIVHRLIIEFGAWNFIQRGFISRWLAKEPWGETEEDRQMNIIHCYHQSNLISYIILQVTSDAQGEKKMRDAKLVGPETSPLLRTDFLPSATEILNGDGLMATFDVIRPAEGGALRLQERSAEEQRLRRVHRTAMVLHDNSEPLGIDSIITTDGADPTESTSTISRSELIREAERQLETRGLMSTLTPHRLEDIRAILRSQPQIVASVVERAGDADILRELLDNEINRRMVASGRGGGLLAVVDDTVVADANTAESTNAISRNELIREAERRLETRGLMANLTPRRLEAIRAILRSQTQIAERAGLEEEPDADLLREILDNEINRRGGGQEADPAVVSGFADLDDDVADAGEEADFLD